ncbi:TonB-dependent receptor plug domain-containing protein [Selenomonas artemidis]|uniref:TonB-dependent receptor plug domain-containing protein n=1 Tax=Selenomonas artemidis TaxID=671224 RepID=UPI000400EFFF|nr:TonB-dependent receptor [Selenomonas artemidis]
MKTKNRMFSICALACMLPVTVQAAETAPAVDETSNMVQTADVNVTAQGYEKPTLDTPVDATVYTADELKKTGAHDVISALKYKNGVHFTQMGPDNQSWITGNAGVNLRGIENGTLVLIDGIPASFNNVSHLDMLTLDTVDRVEVVKGGGSVLYGSEAFGGVVNVITKSSYKNTARIAAGDRGQRVYAATFDLGSVGLALSQTRYGATGNMTGRMGSLTISGVPTPYMVGFGDSRKDHVRLTYRINDRMRLSYMYNGKNHSIHYNDAAKRPLKYFKYDDDEHFTSFNYRDKKGWTADAFYNYRSISNPDYFVVNPSVVEWEKSRHRHFGTDIKKVWKDDVSTTLVGLSVKRQTYVNENQKYVSSSSSSSALRPYAKFGPYAMNEYSLLASYDRDLSPVTAAILSMRQDWVKSTAGDYRAFLPQVQVTTRLGKDSAAYASVGKFFRMPNFRNLYYASAVMRPNPNLKPESGWNYEAGYKYDAGKRRFTAAIFHINVSDQIVGVKDGAVTYQTNAASYRNTGVELSYAEERDAHFGWNVGVTVGNPERKYKEGQPWQRALGRYQMTAGLNYENRALTAALNLSYWGDRGYNGTRNEQVTFTHIPGNLLASNLHVAYRFTPNVTGTFDVDNLFNRRDFTNSGVYYTTGRSFLVGVNCAF